MATKDTGETSPSTMNDFPSPLSSLLKRLSEEIDSNIKNATKETSEFLQHCKKQCNSILSSSQSPKNDEQDTIKATLEKTARLVLDYTFLDENVLVDTEFPAETADKRISAIQDNLDRIFEVARASCSCDVTESLGMELTECVHWRKGALFYMYCHTVDSNGRHIEPAYHKQCLETGILELDRMLSTRKPTPVPGSVGSDDTLQLFNKGIYSDTHLLAMMYAAEMCYWHQQAVDKGRFTSDPVADSNCLSARQQGLCYLDDYLSAVKGPLQGQGWNTSRAEEFEKYLRQSQ